MAPAAAGRTRMEEADGTSENHGSQEWAVPRGGTRRHSRIGGCRRQSVRLDRQDSVFSVPLWRIGEQAVLRRNPFQDWLPGRGSRREEDRGGCAAGAKTRHLAVAGVQLRKNLREIKDR